MNVLITGGSGLLARNWALEKKEEFNIFLSVHSRFFEIPGTKKLSLDLGSSLSLIKAIELNKIDMVIHTAGLTNVEECEKNPKLARLVHVEYSRNIAYVCNLLKIPLISISTDHLFKGDKPFLSEDEKVFPQNVYAETKAEAESVVLDICPDALIVRTNFYGWGPSYRSSFSDWIINSLRKNSTILLFEDVFFTPVNATILAKVVHLLAGKKAHGIYHIGSDERISKFDFAIKLAEIFNLNKNLISRCTLSSRSNLIRRPLDMSLSNLKVKNFLDIEIGMMQDHLFLLREQENLG